MKPIISNLPEFIYQGNDIPEILRLYEQFLRQSDNFQDIAHAGAIKMYHDLITDKKFLALLRKEFDALFSLIEKEFPDLRFDIEGRRKSLISSEDKIIRYLNENKSPDRFRDIFAFRVTIFGKMPESKLVEKCYSLMNGIITYYVHAGHILCEEDPVIGTMAPDSPMQGKMIKPEHTEIIDAYRYGIKDYILNPKSNGYQSLHCVFRTTTGFCFEVQVRTFAMDVQSLEGSADHSAYKKNKYKYQVHFDRNKVHIPGYCVTENGTVYDHVGLEVPLPIIRRYKTF